jgi:hypothetical protein
MLTRVEARTRQGTLLTLPLEDVLNGYTIEEIGGLGPVKAVLVSSSFAGEDGEQEHSSRREARDITLKIGLESDYNTFSVADLRQRLYAFFMPKSEVFLRFVDTSGLEVDIVGRVETCEPDIFSAEPQINVSVHCFRPDFVVPTPVILSGSTVSAVTVTNIDYKGTVDTGFVLTVNVDRAATAFTIYNESPDGTLRQMDFAIPLSAGDIVRISTVTGAKGAILTRAGTPRSVLYGVSPQSSWMTFMQGINKFRVFAAGAAMPYSLEYVTRYGGL